MLILIDVMFNRSGDKVGEVHVATHRDSPHKVQHPMHPKREIDIIDFIRLIHDNKEAFDASGWGAMSKHPDYPGKTISEVFLAEIVRLNDKEARAVMGV